MADSRSQPDDRGDAQGADLADSAEVDAPQGEERGGAAEEAVVSEMPEAPRSPAEVREEGSPAADADTVSAEDINTLLNAARGAPPTASSAVETPGRDDGARDATRPRSASDEGSPETQPFALPELGDDLDATIDPKRVTMLNDVNLRVRLQLGRTRMYLEDVLKLGEGSVVELDKLAGDPVDVLVNDRLIARGEVLVLNDVFCVRICEVLSNDPHRITV